MGDLGVMIARQSSAPTTMSSTAPPSSSPFGPKENGRIIPRP
jgi:hypothetical protein